MKNKKNVLILGSTGSIGKNTIEVISNLNNYRICGIAFSSNISEGLKQINKFNIKNICVFDDKKRLELKKFLGSAKLFPPGIEGLCEMVEKVEADILMLSVSGSIGLLPLCNAIGKIKRICIANKEPVVMAGEIIKNKAIKKNTELIPVDSEPSALFQILNGFNISNVKKVYLTASGGPFYKYGGDFSLIKPSQAVKHPRWKMGRKISIDSATLMNKGLEAIEIKNMFSIDISMIEIVIHPQSIVHSAVEFCDGSCMAQMSYPDMKIPIQYSLTWPNRVNSLAKRLNIFETSKLEFYRPDFNKFKSLKLAIMCAKKGGIYPAILNASNEIAVEMFLNGMIKFNEITDVVERVLSMWTCCPKNKEITIDDIIEADNWAREKTSQLATVVIKERR
ncbi:MAG: 1-deoxy-D-xylulose-5-phosphate reductoisomerase [Elusimicrobiales bacterium]|nr:1-deoxy-D-xylulose-5-phosphate reductoisomerase [Elusimicrobiales bacterium]